MVSDSICYPCGVASSAFVLWQASLLRSLLPGRLRVSYVVEIYDRGHDVVDADGSW